MVTVKQIWHKNKKTDCEKILFTNMAYMKRDIRKLNETRKNQVFSVKIKETHSGMGFTQFARFL